MRTQMVLAFAALAVSAAAEDAPLIRDFDPAATEAIAAHMYRQDQYAWKTTDILLAKYPEKQLRDEKMHGWVVVEGDSDNLVRYIRDGANGPEVAYDILLGSRGESQVSIPASRILPAEQLAQYRARRLALENFDFRCTSTSPNSIAFKDEKSGNWLVWAMTATTDPKLVILGGHIRFTISPDGTTVLSKEKLSKGCGIFSFDDKNGKPSAQYFKNVVSLKPLESHVFANYAYRIPLFIGTTDGVAWKIDQGMIKPVELDAPGSDGFTARAIAGQNESCRLIVKHDENGTPKYAVGDETKVIEATEGDKKFEPRTPSKGEASSVTCDREDLVPAPNDYKVLLAGYPLYISDSGRGHPKRMGVLEVSNGQLQFRLTEGVLSADIAARMQKRLDALQTAYNQAAKKK